jgi:hypothetical protein
MIKQFKNLTEKEKELLFKAPALVSVLAASRDHTISKAGKADAVKLAHLKTFTADPLLLLYYREVEKTFKTHFEAIAKQYAPFDDAKREELKKEIDTLNTVIAKLNKEFARTLHASLARYVAHVKKADNSVLVNFIFPMPIAGLTD